MIKVIALLGCLFVPLSLQAQQSSQDPLSNTAVIKLVKAGFKEKTIIAIIHSRPNRFKLDPDQLIDLKHGGVSENIILAMLSQDQSFASAAPTSGATTKRFSASRRVSLPKVTAQIQSSVPVVDRGQSQKHEGALRKEIKTKATLPARQRFVLFVHLWKQKHPQS